MMFADLPAPDSYAAVGWLVLTFFGLMAGLNYTLAVGEKLRAKKPTQTEIAGQPVEVRAHAGIATQQDLKQVHGRIERERKEIDSEIRRVEAAAEKRATELAHDLKQNTALTQAMSGEVKQINQNVSLILNSITRS